MGDLALEGDFAGSFPYQAHYLDVDGTRLHYVDEGPSDAKPLLMLHGNPTWSYMWRRPIAELTDRGHRCVALDHMGFGRSGKPQRLRDFGLARHIENLVGVVDALDLRDVVLVVHDWGGPIGFGAALQRQERVRAAVAMNTWAWQLPSYLPPFLREFRTEGLGEILGLGGNLIVETIPGGMCRRDPDPEMMDAYRAPFPDYWSRLGPLAFTRDIPLSPRDPSYALFGEISEGLPSLEIPVRFVWAMRDRVFQSVFLDQWRDLFPESDTVEIEDAGHFIVEDSPDTVAEATAEFVASLP